MLVPENHSSSPRWDAADVPGSLPVNGINSGTPVLQSARAADSVESHSAGSVPESHSMCRLEQPALFSNQLRGPTSESSHSVVEGQNDDLLCIGSLELPRIRLRCWQIQW